MDRFVHSLVEASREAGYHVLLFAGRPPRTRSPAYDDLLRSTAVDAFVVTDTYLGNPQAAWLQRAARAVRRLRPALGRPRRPAPVGRRRRRRRRRAGDPAPARARPRADRLDRLAQGLLIGEDRRARLDPGDARPRAARPPAWPPASRTPSASGREASAVLLDEARPTGVRLRLRHPRAWASCTPWPSAACVAGRDVAVVGFDDSQVAQVVPPGLTSVRQPLEEVAVEIVRALEGLLGHPPDGRPGVLLAPTLAVRGAS